MSKVYEPMVGFLSDFGKGTFANKYPYILIDSKVGSKKGSVTSPKSARSCDPRKVCKMAFSTEQSNCTNPYHEELTKLPSYLITTLTNLQKATKLLTAEDPRKISKSRSDSIESHIKAFGYINSGVRLKNGASGIPTRQINIDSSGHKMVTMTEDLITKIKTVKTNVANDFKQRRAAHKKEVEDLKRQNAFLKKEIDKRTRVHQEQLNIEYAKTLTERKKKEELAKKLQQIEACQVQKQQEREYPQDTIDDYIKIVDVINHCHVQLYNKSDEYTSQVKQKGRQPEPSSILKIIINLLNDKIQDYMKREILLMNHNEELIRKLKEPVVREPEQRFTSKIFIFSRVPNVTEQLMNSLLIDSKVLNPEQDKASLPRSLSFRAKESLNIEVEPSDFKDRLQTEPDMEYIDTFEKMDAFFDRKMT